MIIENFTHNDKQYEIKISYNGNEIVIKVFYMDKPANGFSYHVKLEDKHDIKILAGQNIVKELVRIAKEDIVKEKYEGLLESLKFTEKAAK